MSTFNIRPYVPAAVYQTGWAGKLTYPQIYDDLAHYASNVMKNFSITPDELPDCQQVGFIALLETLTQDHDFLADKSRKQTVFFILARCKISSMRYQANQYDSLDALVSSDWHNTADEQIDGMQHQHGERWAGWASQVDMVVDIERIMGKLAAKYEHSLKHLVALYHLTTQVSRVDAARIVGADPSRWYHSYALPMREELRYEFAQVFLDSQPYAAPATVVDQPSRRRSAHHAPPCHAWRKAYCQGNTIPADALLQEFVHMPCMYQALQAQLDGQTVQQAAEHYGQSFHSFKRRMTQAGKLLKAAYPA
ncbi:MAG: hypothetical protein KME04_15320 [Pleurocapsa minor GSE-CHR-MK-17-07R]|jgi:hypothetical protein|nr:hypothetical protein [Pleurocapsa minor GSE-CHR-MK 17-07R]